MWQLRCVQSSSPENLSAGNCNDMSVLERQRAMLQRLYDNEEQLYHDSSQATMPLDQFQNLMNSVKIHQAVDEILPNFGFLCSEVTASLDMDQPQRSSPISANPSRDQHSASTKKRKAKFDEEEECKDKRVEGEAGEVQSVVTVKSERESSGKSSKDNSKVSKLVQKTDYIHVRARRGQATDSHSLAERARREKISKKMKCLQDLVPGCNRVTGKAGMLDEIINYVQSLQKQVEFLSMKLAALNPTLGINMENFFAKEFPPCIANFPAATTPLELVHSAYLHYNQGLQGSTSCGVDTATNSSQVVPQRTETSSISFPNLYHDSVSSLPMSAWESDWQSLYNVSVSRFH